MTPSLMLINALNNPDYCPYCMRCSGNVRMSKVEPYLWKHHCGAIHDERPAMAILQPKENALKTDPSHWNMIPRMVAFKDGKAVASGVACNSYSGVKIEVIHLPTDHYDFIGPVNVVGKTRAEIETEAEHVRQQMTQAG